MEITQEHNAAAGAIVELISDTYGSERGVDPATAISACARLAGSFMFRSFNFKIDEIKPGTVLLSEEANQKGPALINVLGGMLSHFGLVPGNDKMSSTSHVQSEQSFLESMQQLQDPAYAIMNQNRLDAEQMAYVCAMSTAFIIKECRNDFAIETGFHTAVYCFIEGSKTCPPKLVIVE